MQSALGVIEAKAHFDGPVRQVFVRVGGAGDRMYLDLADERWRAIEVSPAAGALSIARRFASVGSLG